MLKGFQSYTLVDCHRDVGNGAWNLLLEVSWSIWICTVKTSLLGDFTLFLAIFSIVYFFISVKLVLAFLTATWDHFTIDQKQRICCVAVCRAWSGWVKLPLPKLSSPSPCRSRYLDFWSLFLLFCGFQTNWYTTFLKCISQNLLWYSLAAALDKEKELLHKFYNL